MYYRLTELLAKGLTRCGVEPKRADQLASIIGSVAFGLALTALLALIGLRYS